MKDISEIEDEYKTSFDNLIERYKVDLKNSKDKKALRERFNLNLKRIISRRNKAMSLYIKKNKKKILGLPERKEKKYEKVKPYKMYEFSFKPTFFERCRKFFGFFGFYLKIYFRWIYYNFIPPFLKKCFFKIKFWFGSIFYDFFVYVNDRFANIITFFKKFFGGLKKFFIFVFEKISVFLNKISKKIEDFKKKRAEKKKIKRETKEKAKEEERKKAEDIEKEDEKDLESFGEEDVDLDEDSKKDALEKNEGVSKKKEFPEVESENSE